MKRDIVQRYQSKPKIIEAIQLTPFNMTAVEEFVGGDIGGAGGEVIIATLEGPLRASMHDYIIKGIKGEFYPCKPDIFENSYKMVEA